MHYTFKSTPTCTFKSRNITVTRSNQLSSLPGPGDYNTVVNFHKSPMIAMAKSNRNLFEKPQSFPPPGHYQQKSYINEGNKKSLSHRYLEPIRKSPGPQDYCPNQNQLRNTAPSFSLGAKSKSLKQIIFDKNDYKPSPASYQMKQKWQKKHYPKFGTSKRKDLTETQKTPSPNLYEVQIADKYASTCFGNCKIGTDTKKTSEHLYKCEESPGPAAYPKKSFIESNLQKSKGYTIRQKIQNLQTIQLSKIPGPGSYETGIQVMNNKNSAPKYSTTKALRSTFIQMQKKHSQGLPQPSKYNPQFSGTKYSSSILHNFGKEKRKSLDQHEKTPGPAAYHNSVSMIKNSVPSFSVPKLIPHQEYLKANNPETPSPCQYDPKITLIKRSISVSQLPKQKRPDFSKHRLSPAPGFYNLRGQEKGPKFKFPSQKRSPFTDLPNQSKGGKHYEITGKIANPPNYMGVQQKLQYKSKNR